jgi:hypothetical protein
VEVVSLLYSPTPSTDVSALDIGSVFDIDARLHGIADRQER